MDDLLKDADYCYLWYLDWSVEIVPDLDADRASVFNLLNLEIIFLSNYLYDLNSSYLRITLMKFTASVMKHTY